MDRLINMLHDIKIWLRLVVAILLAVIVSGAGLIHWATLEQKHIAVDQAKDFAHSVHQMTLAGLTGMMITGTISLRTIFLDQIKETNHVESLKVYRSDAVIRQFGPGLEGETPVDPAEIRVMHNGKAEFFLVPNGDGTERLRAIIPAVAQENYLGKNCTFCHSVTAGTVLGAISMDISLARAYQTTSQFGRNAVLAAAALCVPLGFFIWYFISRLVSRPLHRMTDGLNRIAEGDIDESCELPLRGRDEVGLATAAFNRVMAKAADLIRQQRLSRIVFDNSLEGIAVTDAQSRFQLVNKAFSDTTGYSADEVLGQMPNLLKSGRQEEGFYADFWKALQEQGEWRGEIWNKRKNGSIYPEWLNVSAVKNARDEIEHYVAIFSDITERKEREQLMTFQAFHDALTGLPNRILFRDRLEQALAQAKRHKHRTPAVMFLDLDRFKQINDTLGHDAGDVLLKEVANRLRRCVRESDTVARLAGDEFTVLLPDIAEENDAHTVAEKVLAAMHEPIRLGREERVITTSIGISMFPRDGRDADTLVKCADTAMYHVKGSGRAGMCFFAPELLGKPTRRHQLATRLKDAFINREFVLHYQPIIDLETGIVHGKEALIRWQTPDSDLLYPEDFLGLAEEAGLMVQMGEWVLETACLQARLWQLEKHPVTVAVNLSASEFRRPDLADAVRAILKRAGLSPKLLEIEVSETLAMQDIEYSERAFRALADLGVLLAIDDFGTGYSSLSALRRLPVQTLKIDRSLIRKCLGPEGDRSIIAATFGIAEALGFKAVAEGVENAEELALLQSLSFKRAQGYFLAVPAPTGTPVIKLFDGVEKITA